MCARHRSARFSIGVALARRDPQLTRHPLGCPGGFVSVHAPTTAELWLQALQAFEPHRRPTDPDAQAALNRIAAKCLRSVEVRSYDPRSCSIRLEVMTPLELAGLERYHTRTTPNRTHEPIVVLESDGRRIVIDGNSRVNKWLGDGSSQSRSAIVISSPVGGAA